MVTDNIVNEIYPGLWLGDINSASDLKFLRAKKISCIINCTLTIPFPKLPQIKYRHRVPVKDNMKPEQIYLMYRMLDEAINFIIKHLPEEQILIHCYAGRQRSVAVVAGFLMKTADIRWDEALQCIRSKREVAAVPQFNFETTLRQYQDDLDQMKSIKNIPVAEHG